ncbi:MAG: hypothetical protein ACXAB6_06230, partial [Candidatus Thorarchaeota archaeon]
RSSVSNWKIMDLVSNVVTYAYPELRNCDFVVNWRKMSSFAIIRWEYLAKRISISLDKSVMAWPEPAMFGLISHELSHPGNRRGGLSEEETDLDAIDRGLGPYLAIERIFAGKYLDHIVSKKRDKYLGYASIRDLLTSDESNQLNKLLRYLRLCHPTKDHHLKGRIHDTYIQQNSDTATIVVAGRRFNLDSYSKDSDVKLIVRNNIVSVYLDEELVGEFEDSNSDY